MNDAIDGFLKALTEAGVTLDKSKITIDNFGCPHTPKGLPSGKMAIYTFQKDGRYLKIGKAGPNSDARFRSQHYSPYRAKTSEESSAPCGSPVADSPSDEV